MTLELTGVGLITGSGGGIGRATALQFTKDGCRKLVLTDIAESTLQETVQLCKDISPDVRIEPIVGDLTSEEFVDGLVSQAILTFGRLDYAVNCAGIGGKAGATAELELEDFRAVQRVNVEALWLCQRAEVRVMLKQEMIDGTRGSIVNISSVWGVNGAPRAAPYTMSKHAVIGFTKGDALAYAVEGIRVNSVSPGLIDTPLTRPAKDRFEQVFVPFVPMRRWGQSSEVAHVIAFLSSSRASFVTGANYLVDGGYSAQ